MTEIIAAIITLLGSAAGAFSGILINSRLTSYRLEQLEKKVEKHNKVVERVYVLENHDAVKSEALKVVNHRISDLEDYHR